MKTIEKLRPPGLLDVSVLTRVIVLLYGVIERHAHDSRAVLKLTRIIGRLQKQDRENRNFNLNMQIKMWVMQCQDRIAWVRGIIGEAAIRRWQRRYDIALGRNVPSSLSQAATIKNKTPKDRVQRQLVHGVGRSRAVRPYDWKRFGLVPLSEVVIIAGVENSARNVTKVTNKIGQWSQPRSNREMKPVTFMPFELRLEAAKGIATCAGAKPEPPPPKPCNKAVKEAFLKMGKGGEEPKPP